ncbi:general transcription factor 3C polypeptide 3 isoform X2 [Xiphophorus couchianus]|uniref:general transcription factor 3C polypeptide 3 isoform X2 n=1 Tax=Xiphophorus couchianus TaxID=32473 RepID=UPI0010167B4D|nr:general transcription factor 3C polypeptide 3 isoform X2 [Xiphophorus couchianus]
MSGFSAELIDYLEGRITFEEFDRRRDERKAEDSEEFTEDENKPSTSAQTKATIEDGVSPGVQQAFASILGETAAVASSEEEDSLSYVDDKDDRDFNVEEEEEAKGVTKERKRRLRQGGKRGLKSKLEEEEEDMTVGDVFKLEMELNRENRRLMKGRRHGSKLPQALRGLMGEANIRYARGEKEDAILMCMEIIRQSPLAYEPFSTLAMIYEDNGDVDKALQFGLIAAHLNPSDCEEWIRLADMSLEQDNVRQAIICYTKAIKYDPTNVRYLWERSSLQMRLGEHKQCMDGYRKILSLLPQEDGEHFMQLSKDMAKNYYESNDLPSALSVIEEGLARHPGLVSDDFLNMAAELYICNRQYKKTLQVLVKFADIVLIRAESLSESSALSLKDMGTEEQQKEGEKGTKSNTVEDNECLKALGHMKEAAESYTKVVEMAPLHLEARLSLATVQQQLGRMDCALKALESMYDSDTLAQDSSAAQKELKLLLHRSTLLKTQGKMEDYLDAMITMISMLLKVAMQRAKVCVRSVTLAGQNHLKLVKIEDMLPEIADHESAYLDNMCKTNVLSKEDWWQLLLSCLLGLCDLQRYEEVDLLVESAMEFYSFYDNKPRRKELEFFGLSATVLNQNYYKAYNYIRLMLIENVDLPQFWNIFHQLTISSQHQRHHRFCLRLLLKHPDNHALCVLCGHNAMVSGSFKHALGQYIQALKTHPENPLHSLYVGLTFFHMASQKYVAKRHALVLQGFSFLWRYVELRGACQESMYNLGRALHQMGLTHLAIHYYQKALLLPAWKLDGISGDQVDLRREIAFNLSLIYQASGNTEMARQLIRTHCTI